MCRYNAGESQNMVAKLAQAQLTINKCDMLIAKQALRIDELERVLHEFLPGDLYKWFGSLSGGDAAKVAEGSRLTGDFVAL